jgi:hypothetical protein
MRLARAMPAALGTNSRSGEGGGGAEALLHPEWG